MLPHIRNAVSRATEIYHDSGAKARVEQDGYTRVDPFLIAGGEGVPVLLRPLEKLLGAFIREDVSGILVNSERSAGLIHLTCAHELGHYFMGHDTTGDETMDFGPRAAHVEQEADWFAYHLLASRGVLANIMRRKHWSVQSLKNPFVLYQLSLRLGISYTATGWSLVRQKILNADQVKDLLKVQPIEIKRALLEEREFDSRKEVWLLDESDRASVLEPRADDQVLVRLKSNASSGYLWSLDELASEGFEVRPVPRSPEQIPDPEQLVFGGVATAEFLLTLDEAAKSRNGDPLVLAMKEQRPWLKGAEANATFETRTKYEQIGPGLTRAAKQQLLRESSLA
ncbi:ImmA/IrrE family metallo-endopeptidase [Lysobacter soli]|uniref:ImmA/IrrE family metallo-endopeptidase n=1 Tax=Lysobacter soli TaxID=453783 RepID=A0A3D8VBB0_9GAMM|nr:ImmA/IrrE family metallo-endopeptidase [Lysobacter soli]RDY66712.1 ImmA/IrrE family metallo-endopeptidase [Lysobacter soli]